MSEETTNPAILRRPAFAGTADEATVVIKRRRRSEQRTFVTIRVVSGVDIFKVCAVYLEERVTVGRGDNCELVVNDKSVSREHLAVTVHEDGVVVEDLDSSNGTVYRGQQVKGQISIDMGTDLMVGNILLRIERLGMNELTRLARLRLRVERAHDDPLCRVLERDHLTEVLPDQLRSYNQAQIPVTACVLDIDHFEKVNETYGREVCGEILEALARLLVACIRDSDDIVGSSEDEFVLLLPNCEIEGGRSMAERIRRSIEAYDWAARSPDRWNPLFITASMGVAQYAGEDVAEWLASAFEALGRAKEGGRNRTVAASPGLF